MLTIKNNHLYQDNHRIFYLADTCWGAFTSINMPDWRYYLDTRKAQGYNAVQINVLRQWDSSLPIAGHEPFVITDHSDGSYEYDYSKINESYFDNAEKMLKEVTRRGMIPVLVLLWGNYVPDTWMSHFVKNNVMPFEQVKPYVKYAVNRFKKFNPIWFVSGDVGFVENEMQKTAEPTKYYREVLDTAKSIDPSGLYAFHINGESHDLPKEFLDKIDFFIYQSGHGADAQATSYIIPQWMREHDYTGPMMDAEICYEGMTKMHAPNVKAELLRFTAYDIRKAAWKAVLSGADMGIGYGCFGIWPWKDTSHPEQELGENFNVEIMPYDWRQCLQFPGARDMGYLKDIISEYAGEGLQPLYKPVESNPDIRAAEDENYLLIYLPTAIALNFNELGIEPKEARVIDLQKRIVLTGKIENNVLQLPFVLEDSLIIIKK